MILLLIDIGLTFFSKYPTYFFLLNVILERKRLDKLIIVLLVLDLLVLDTFFLNTILGCLLFYLYKKN